MVPLLVALGAGLADAPAASTVEEARQRFRRGVELHEEGDLAGAQAEFARAYELVPSYKILYNLGQIAYEQRDYATALQRFSRYLHDGGGEIGESRRRAVETEIERLQQRIGRIAIAAPPPGAQLYVDDLAMGTATPLGPVAVNVGRRKVEIVAPGGEREVRFVDVAGGATVEVRFDRPPRRLAPAESAGAAAAGLVRVAGDGRAGSAVRPRARSSPWPGWVISGLLAAGAGVAGGVALSDARALERQRASYPASYDDLQRTQADAHRWALVTDGLLIGTGLALLVTTWLTLR